MKIIQHFNAEARKLTRDEKIKYSLWVDDGGSLFVQFDGNEKAGSFSKLLFSVSKYASIRNTTYSIGFPEGYDLQDKKVKNSKNENDRSFLKAVLIHLIDDANNTMEI